MVMLASVGKAIVRIRNKGTVDFDVFDLRERVLLYEFVDRRDPCLRHWVIGLNSSSTCLRLALSTVLTKRTLPL